MQARKNSRQLVGTLPSLVLSFPSLSLSSRVELSMPKARRAAQQSATESELDRASPDHLHVIRAPRRR